LRSKVFVFQAALRMFRKAAFMLVGGMEDAAG